MNNKNPYRACVGGFLLLILSVIGLLSSIYTDLSNAIFMIYLVPQVTFDRLLRMISSPSFRQVFTLALPSLVGSVISSLPMIIFALLLVMKKHNKALTLVAAIMSFTQLFVALFNGISTIITYAASTRMISLGVITMVNLLAQSAFRFSVLLLCIKSVGKAPGSAKGMRMLPVILYILTILISLVFTWVSTTIRIMNRPLEDLIVLAAPVLFFQLLLSIPLLLAWILSCGWIANPYKAVPQPQPLPYQAPQYQAPQYQQPQQPGWQGSYGQQPRNPGQ